MDYFDDSISKDILSVFEEMLKPYFGNFICSDGRINTPMMNVPYVDFCSKSGKINDTEFDEALTEIYKIARDNNLLDYLEEAIERARLSTEVSLQLFTKCVKCESIYADVTSPYNVINDEYLVSSGVLELVRTVLTNIRKHYIELGKTNNNSLKHKITFSYPDDPKQFAVEFYDVISRAAFEINKYSYSKSNSELCLITNAVNAGKLNFADYFVPNSDLCIDNKLTHCIGYLNVCGIHINVYVDPFMNTDDMDITLFKAAGSGKPGLHIGLYRGEVIDLATTDLSVKKRLLLKYYVTDLGNATKYCITISDGKKITQETTAETQDIVYEPVPELECTIDINIDEFLI